MNICAGNACVAACMLFSVLSLSGCGDRDKPETLIAAGKELLSKGEYRTASLQFRNALEKSPDSPEARFLLGKALLEMPDPAGAEVELRRARELRYPIDEVLPLLLRAQLALGQNAKVIEEASKAAVLSASAKAVVQSRMAAAHLALGDRAAAGKAIDQALLAQADNAEALLLRSRLLAISSDFDGALGVIAQIVAKDPRNFEAFALRGDVQRTKGNYFEAVESFDKAVEIRPEMTGARAAAISVLIAQSSQAKTAQIENAVKRFEVLKQ